jgi:tRNA nucleotidyltransferase (CCA-adding enzyme)
MGYFLSIYAKIMFMKDFSYGVVPIVQKTKNIKDARFLLIKQSNSFWSFPKGHPEEGESEVETARREFFEETGITPLKMIEDIIFVEKYTWNDRGVEIDKTVKFFPCFCQDFFVKVDEKEVSEAKWLSYEEACEIITYKETQQVLDEAFAWLKSQN